MFELANRMVGIYKVNNATGCVTIDPEAILRSAQAINQKRGDPNSRKAVKPPSVTESSQPVPASNSNAGSNAEVDEENDENSAEADATPGARGVKRARNQTPSDRSASPTSRRSKSRRQ
jgi:hypothetical protein